jgi:hypothetical protein
MVPRFFFIVDAPLGFDPVKRAETRRRLDAADAGALFAGRRVKGHGILGNRSRHCAGVSTCRFGQANSAGG